MAAVANNHKSTYLKQHKCIILHFWRSEVWHRSHWIKSRCQQSCISLGSCRGNPSPCLLQLLEATCTHWLVALLHLPVSNGWLGLSSHHADMNSSSFCFQGPLWLHWTDLDNTGNTLYTGQLISKFNCIWNFNPHLPFNETSYSFKNVDIFAGGHNSAHYSFLQSHLFIFLKTKVYLEQYMSWL